MKFIQSCLCNHFTLFSFFFCKFLKHSKFIGEHEFPDLGSVHCNNYNYIIFSKKSSGLWSHRCVLVSRTLSKVFNPSLRSQRDWVSADGAALHTQPVCTSPAVIGSHDIWSVGMTWVWQRQGGTIFILVVSQIFLLGVSAIFAFLLCVGLVV